jgi:hypothetical protein
MPNRLEFSTNASLASVAAAVYADPDAAVHYWQPGSLENTGSREQPVPV